MLERNRFRREKLHWKIVWKRVFLQRQRKRKGLRAFAQSLLTAGLGIVLWKDIFCVKGLIDHFPQASNK